MENCHHWWQKLKQPPELLKSRLSPGAPLPNTPSISSLNLINALLPAKIIARLQNS